MSRQLTKKRIITFKPIKRSSTSFIIREMKIGNYRENHFSQHQIGNNSKSLIFSGGEVVDTQIGEGRENLIQVIYGHIRYFWLCVLGGGKTVQINPKLYFPGLFCVVIWVSSSGTFKWIIARAKEYLNVLVLVGSQNSHCGSEMQTWNWGGQGRLDSSGFGMCTHRFWKCE